MIEKPPATRFLAISLLKQFLQIVKMKKAKYIKVKQTKSLFLKTSSFF